jgi:hypothetical protein
MICRVAVLLAFAVAAVSFEMHLVLFSFHPAS